MHIMKHLNVRASSASCYFFLWAMNDTPKLKSAVKIKKAVHMLVKITMREFHTVQ